MSYFGIEALKVDYSPSKAKYPDIWVELNRVPIITVTDEWRKQKASERRKRLVHEALHACGLQHGKMGKYVYHTKPDKDTFSKKVYQDLLKVMG